MKRAASKHDGTVEVVVGTLITFRGKVLLIQSTKWGDLWLFPGGHIEHGESLFKAAEREGEEETGLKLHAQYVINFGENIFLPDFHRRAHMMFYHVVCEAENDEVKLDSRELKKYEWLKPEEALKKHIFPTNIASIKRLMAGERLTFESR